MKANGHEPSLTDIFLGDTVQILVRVVSLVLAVGMFAAGPAEAGGLTDGGAALWAQGANDLGGTSEAGDAFGSALATGDFNGDGFQDLAVGIPAEDNNYADDGAVVVIHGTATGLNATVPNDTFLYHEDPGGHLRPGRALRRRAGCR